MEEADVTYADETVARDKNFQDVLKQRKGVLSELLDTAVIEFSKRD